MAKKIIQAQMKQRTDTAANWASANPVLLKGELGIVSDDPNLYKVGDGVTSWLSLPFRGFDGTLVHETGTSKTAVMSQSAVTNKFVELKEMIAAQDPKIIKSDWNEDDGAKSSYVRNRTHYIKGSNITGAGTYRATTGRLLFEGKLFDLPADTTEITISSGPIIKAKWIATESQVIVTTGSGGDSYLEAYPIKVVEEFVPLDENFIPDSIARKEDLTALSQTIDQKIAEAIQKLQMA